MAPRLCLIVGLSLTRDAKYSLQCLPQFDRARLLVQKKCECLFIFGRARFESMDVPPGDCRPRAGFAKVAGTSLRLVDFFNSGGLTCAEWTSGGTQCLH